jgi:penicillin-binding protein 1C
VIAASADAVPPPRRARRRRWLLGTAWTVAALSLLDALAPPPIPDIGREGSTLVLARDGTPLRAFAAADGVWRYPIALDGISPLYLEALLNYEDRWFRWHPGVNPLALARAGGQALWHGEIVSGGSTLTMQVARLIEPMPRNGWGKIKQMLRAMQLEWRLSKDEILTLYLNLAPFGGNIQGVQAASWAYLGKPAHQLSRAEAALLAVLPQAPSRLRPDRHAAQAKVARDKVLARLAQFNVWPADALAEAQLEPVTARRLQPPLTAALLAERARREQPAQRVLRTTVDPRMQQFAERRVWSHLAALPARTSAAVLIVDNREREARAYVGSARFGDAERLGHVDMIAAVRSPGSTLKPFVYGLALEDGLIHSESLLIDAPQSFDGYRPANFGEHFNGPVSAAEALRLSLNVPAVDLLARVTPQRFTARLRHAGVELQLPQGAKPNLSIILGGTGTRLSELVGAYAALGNDGVGGPVRWLTDTPREDRQVLSVGANWVVRAMLEAHVRPGDSVLNLDMSRRVRLAWKTGTSYGFRDSWAIGVTPTYTVGVWIGRPDGTPMPGQYGAATALPLLFGLVDGLPRTPADTQPAVPPEQVAQQAICWPLGVAFDATQADLCHEKRDAWVIDQVIPPTLPSLEDQTFEPLLVTVPIDPRTQQRVLADCAPAQTQTRAIARWPTLAQPWLSAAQRRRSAMPELAPGCREPAALTQSLRIAGVVPGAVLRRAPGANDAPGLDLRALGASSPVRWLVNGRWVGETEPRIPLNYRFEQPGEQVIVALDARGHYDRISVRVLE